MSMPRFSALFDALGISVAEQLSYVKSRHKNIDLGDNNINWLTCMLSR
jgi:hypothetical protein